METPTDGNTETALLYMDCKRKSLHMKLLSVLKETIQNIMLMISSHLALLFLNENISI